MLQGGRFMGKEDSMEKYHKIFQTDKEKAEAFDKIAAEYYFGNFGRMQKSDFETLLFSLYLEQILSQSEADMQTYSDYILSKNLGITQSKVSNLKVKKELQYPYENFKWQESFKRISNNARYENGKIRINIPDKNLYYELKNEIEKNGSYVDVQLSGSLLQILPEDYIDLMVTVGEEKDRIAVRKDIKEKLKGQNIDADYWDKEPIGDILKKNAKSVGIEFLADLIEKNVPIAGKYIAQAIKDSFK